jgi:zinc transport system ATP-binding protein
MPNTIIQVKDLSYTLNHQTILQKVNFSVDEADYIGLLGPNGGGKTTLIKLILGILRPTTGSIALFDGHEMNPKDKIGYVPQRVGSGGLDFPATVEEVIQSGLSQKNLSKNQIISKIAKALEVAQISELANRRLSDLSGGQRQKVFIARSLVDDPQILILDEPTVAIDLQSQASFYSFLRYLNKEMRITILLISHDISAIAQEVNKIYFLDQNLTCYHDSQEFLDHGNLDTLYGKNINLISHHH